MEFRLRLVPIALVAILALLGIKLADAWFALETPLAPVRAEAATPASPAPAASAAMPLPPATSAPAAAKPVAAGTTPATPGTTAGNTPAAIDPLSMSPSEVELLQDLARRRAELDKRAAELSQRAVLLQATEKRIDEKIAKLAELKKDIGGIVSKQSQEDDARLQSLVKIYETMKPNDAARIFSQLDMPVLLGVLERMKERSAAPILAAMDPSKAKAVTLALAERKDQRVEAATAADAPPASPAAPATSQ